MIDFSPLQAAVEQLGAAREEQAREPHRKLLRAGLIQTFEYTYELSHKMLRRHLALTDPSPAVIEGLSFDDLIRRGGEADLLQAPIARWRQFREARSITSHTYNEVKAGEVAALIPAFHEEVRYLLERLVLASAQTSALPLRPEERR